MRRRFLSLQPENPEFDGYVAQARSGSLPADFDKWDMAATPGGRTVAHEAAMVGASVPDQLLSLTDGNGVAVAHFVAQHRQLPEWFGLDLADKNGWTVAHYAARCGHLPPGFDQWGLADKNGHTVAHEAAIWGLLPGWFDQWGLADGKGWTVYEAAKEAGCLPKTAQKTPKM